MLPVNVVHDLEEEAGLRFQWDRERIDTVGRDDRIAMHRLMCQVHLFNGERGRAFRDIHGLVGNPRNLFRGQDRTRRKPPRPPIQHTNTNTTVRPFADFCDATILPSNGLSATVHHTHVAVLDTGSTQPRQCEFCKFIPVRCVHDLSG